MPANKDQATLAEILSVVTELRKEVLTLKSEVKSLKTSNVPELTTTLKTKKKRDPNAPKRPKSAWMFFSKEWSDKLKKDETTSDMTWSEQKTELGRMWREDYPEESDRKKWQKKAVADKERYVQEMESYDSTSSSNTE